MSNSYYLSLVTSPIGCIEIHNLCSENQSRAASKLNSSSVADLVLLRLTALLGLLYCNLFNCIRPFSNKPNINIWLVNSWVFSACSNLSRFARNGQNLKLSKVVHKSILSFLDDLWDILVDTHSGFLEHWNSQKSLCYIWQRISWLLNEWIKQTRIFGCLRHPYVCLWGMGRWWN